MLEHVNKSLMHRVENWNGKLWRHFEETDGENITF